MKYTKYLSVVITLALLVVPLFASAQLKNTGQLLMSVYGLVGMMVNIAAGLALLAFFWGLAKFIFAVSGDEGAVKVGKTFMMWGIIALFVLASIKGIIFWLERELALPPGNNLLTPPGGGGSLQMPNSPFDPNLRST